MSISKTFSTRYRRRVADRKQVLKAARYEGRIVGAAVREDGRLRVETPVNILP
ncbi:hypothetical protein CH06BL_31080 [Chromobacterium haemolyticum]|nr:hypothetical protein CH06BL_31080 [Chromobacterium haemolyticum]